MNEEKKNFRGGDINFNLGLGKNVQIQSVQQEQKRDI